MAGDPELSGAGGRDAAPPELSPALRPGAEEDVYILTRTGRRTAVRVRRRDGSVEELGSFPRSRVAPTGVASAILGDGLVSPPSTKLVRDYSRFVPDPGPEAREIPASEVAAWLATWDPAIEALFRRFR